MFSVFVLIGLVLWMYVLRLWKQFQNCGLLWCMFQCLIILLKFLLFFVVFRVLMKVLVFVVGRLNMKFGQLDSMFGQIVRVFRFGWQCSDLLSMKVILLCVWLCSMVQILCLLLDVCICSMVVLGKCLMILRLVVGWFIR